MLRLVMTPGTGERVVRHVGDRLRVEVRTDTGAPLPTGWRVMLRTNLGRAAVLRREIIHSYPSKPPLAGAAWHDIPMAQEAGQWQREIVLAEPGYFQAKAYAADPQGRQHWPEGSDLGVSVHPDWCRAGNTVYGAFTRMFGASRAAETTRDPKIEQQLAEWDRQHFTVIPPSGKLRDLVRQFPHIFGRLRCRLLQLLPVTPVPTTFARFGRYGSPYAVQDLTAVDPALVEFDKRTTGIDQFRELTFEAHRWGGRVLLDIPINHTGWGATLQERHPEWYLRNERGEFVSPGAWGVTWEDLVELNLRHPELWRDLAEVFLTWCRRGVDGFRCDAGYKIPVEVWRYITARVFEEFPETVFFLEGLGGALETTEQLLTEGGMQWAYSELFQNYDGRQVASYLDYSLRQCERAGLYLHYSETHDNDRLAARGRAWSLLRNRLCALTSVSGAYGITCGVEWLAPEKINVHSCRGLRWDHHDNIVSELAVLNELLAAHPCFQDGARLTRLSAADSAVYALRRDAAGANDSVLVLANTDLEGSHTVALDLPGFTPARDRHADNDMLGQPLPQSRRRPDGKVELKLPPAAVHLIDLCAAPAAEASAAGSRFPRTSVSNAQAAPLSAYALARARAAWAVQALAQLLPAESIGSFDWSWLAGWVHESPARFLGCASALAAGAPSSDLRAGLEAVAQGGHYPPVVVWHASDQRRVTPVPRDHWLLIQDEGPFRVRLQTGPGPARQAQSIRVQEGHVACFAPGTCAGEGTLEIERYAAGLSTIRASVRFLPASESAPAASGEPQPSALPSSGGVCGGEEFSMASAPPAVVAPGASPLVLLTNGRGGMARLCVDLGRIASKYDCLLGANLHPSIPVDRHVLAKRVRAWLMADGFITPLNGDNLVAFEAGPPAVWRFLAAAGDARAAEIELAVSMPEDRNTVTLSFRRLSSPPRVGRELPDSCRVSLVLRVDIEDRSFHGETHRNGGAEHHFSAHTRTLESGSAPGATSGGAGSSPVGFVFAPAADRQLRVFCDRGFYHPEPEWCERIAHPVEATRGQVAEGDAFSPGWFEAPMAKGEAALLVVTAESEPESATVGHGDPVAPVQSGFERRLIAALKAFVVRRGQGRTVIAGYPWFLDWGRDTLIAARGLLAAGMTEDVTRLLATFGRFEDRGTLPNAIHGDDASNRDTSDAPLWYSRVCEDWGRLRGEALLLSTPVDGGKRSFAQVLASIAAHYASGTPNGIRMDPESGLIWSPSHFTWMDTNYPAGTPREGYPVEIQALWIGLLRLLARLDLPSPGHDWTALADRASAAFRQRFWLEGQGWLADVLLAGPGTPASKAAPSDCLRPNCLLAVTSGLIDGDRARRCVAAAQRHLLVPGAIRSLAPLPAHPPLPVCASDGRLLNDPGMPYWGRYEGDEDTRRKPAYHNGTAWLWQLPLFCEALARAWDFQPGAVSAARAYLLGMERLMDNGCLGHLPEIIDGDAPHTPRGCDAQAWSVSEALRVWKALTRAPGSSDPRL